jgi:lipopolysaccharide/colanic/teichoic acid biosynthesis glycosyltransferase
MARSLGLEIASTGRPRDGAGSSATAFEGVTAASQPHVLYDFQKRALDICAGALLLTIALPLIAVAAVLAALSTGASPIVLQRRVGFKGRQFTMLKLRTMRAGGDEGSAPAAKLPDDPRVTRVGRILRRTSIDELPQLVNVLLGQMSLVGPRPSLPSEVEHFSPSWQRRFSVKPGLTCLWQVSGRSRLPLERWMAMDRWYVRRRSALLDYRLLLQTVPAVVLMRGAW